MNDTSYNETGNRRRTLSRQGMPLRVSDPDMHLDTCVTHMPWRLPRSLTSGFIWSRWRGKRSRHSRRMRNPQFFVSGKRPIKWVTKDYRTSTVPVRYLSTEGLDVLLCTFIFHWVHDQISVNYTTTNDYVLHEYERSFLGKRLQMFVT